MNGKKTYGLVIIGLISLLYPVFTGQIGVAEFLASQEWFRALELGGLGTIRHAVSKLGK